jgi:DNA-binding SARP family transcriptional activator
MLGTLSVSQNGLALDLPASRKVRALLAYLALTPRATARVRICRLLWDTASDPRGELRWALSKLRGVLGAARIRSSEDFIQLDLADARVDALEVQRAARAGIAGLEPARARDLLALFDGEFLEGLELDSGLERSVGVLRPGVANCSNESLTRLSRAAPPNWRTTLTCRGVSSSLA